MSSSLDYAWQEQSVWSQVANRVKARLQLKRRTALGLAVAGAVLSTSAATVGLDTAVRQINDDAADLREHRVGLSPKARALPGVHDVSTYMRERVEHQISEYYEERVRELKAKLQKFRWAG